jgi:hypothetical protein
MIWLPASPLYLFTSFCPKAEDKERIAQDMIDNNIFFIQFQFAFAYAKIVQSE